MTDLPPSGPLTDVQSAASSATPTWMLFAGAIFGAVTLASLFYFANAAGTNSTYICSSYQLFAAAFAIGAALSASFIGGGITARGNIAGAAFTAFGGIGTLIVVFVIFLYFRPDACNNVLSSLKSQVADLQSTNLDLTGKLTSTQKQYSDLTSRFQDANKAVDFFVTQKSTITVALQSARQSIDSLGDLPKILANSCGTGPGFNPMHFDQMVQIAQDAREALSRAASALSAINDQNFVS